MSDVIIITARGLLVIGLATIAAVFTLPSGITSAGGVSHWIPLLWVSCSMIAAGCATRC